MANQILNTVFFVFAVVLIFNIGLSCQETSSSTTSSTTAVGGGGGGGASTPKPKDNSAKLEAKALKICDIGTTEICGADETSPNDGCSKIGTVVSPDATQCDGKNLCSFDGKVSGVSKVVYVSYQKQDGVTGGNGEVYKTCPNGIIIYSLYPSST